VLGAVDGWRATAGCVPDSRWWWVVGALGDVWLLVWLVLGGALVGYGEFVARFRWCVRFRWCFDECVVWVSDLGNRVVVCCCGRAGLLGCLGLWPFVSFMFGFEV
jgi:hypothetical protein